MGRRSLSDPRLASNSVFEQMLADHLTVVSRTAVRLAGRTQEAQDMTQDTFLRAWRSRHTFRPETNAKAWLLRILHNVNIDRFRAAKRMVPTVSELNGLDPAFTVHDTPESLVLAGFMEAEVFEALRGLPERLRTCLLADLQGLPQAEIAKDLGVPSGTVMSRLFRARQRLQRRLQPYVRNRRLIRRIHAEVGTSPPTRTENTEIADVSRE
jgi:RNA polymerase sigma-70 factor (ECF subfamily)